MIFGTENIPLKNKSNENFDATLGNHIKTLKLLIFWLFTVFIPFFLTFGIIGLLGLSFDESTFENPSIYFLSVILGEISIILMGIIFLRFEKRSYIRNTGLTWEKNRSLKFLGLGLLIGSVIILLRDSLSVIFHIQAISNQDMSNISYLLFSLLIAGLIGLLTAIAEEGVYRGIIQNNLSQHLPNYLAIGITSLLFVFPHAIGTLGSLELLAIFLHGLLLGLAYMFTNRLYLPIGLHFGNNFMIIFLDSCLGYSNVNVTSLVLFQVLFTIIVLILFLVYKKRSQFIK